MRSKTEGGLWTFGLKKKANLSNSSMFTANCSRKISYLEYDLSLGEIAEDKGVSRQSVSDCLKKSCRRLKEFEEILGTIALKKEIAERSRKCEEALFAAEGAEKDLESRFYSAEGNGEAFATLRGALADLKRITATKES